jgi:hypothetical protein
MRGSSERSENLHEQKEKIVLDKPYRIVSYCSKRHRSKQKECCQRWDSTDEFVSNMLVASDVVLELTPTQVAL